ncbi:MAG: 16S rRNA processing protein RimM [Selenomonas ruminantium]|nr:16S rRNA processing protein RimM [Selenomonas ruminantium]
MDSISLKMPVTIKAKLTEKLREKMIKELDEGISRAQLEVQQIEIQAKRAIQENEVPEPTVTDIQRLNMIKQHFGEERQKRLDFIAESQQRREDAQKLVLGAEIVQGTLERQVEVHVGDDMRELMNVEVLVEDDKIVAIRG